MENDIVYEKVFYFDTSISKNQIFNAIKSTLITNSNYKYSKIDEDRTSGNITTVINFEFNAKPGMAKLVFNARSQMSIDVKENRYRIRFLNNTANTTVIGATINYVMHQVYIDEKKQILKNKWKESKSLVVPWHESLFFILNAFDLLVAKELKDDNF
jgi:hypothetical protein